MTRTRRPDLVTELFERSPETKKSWVKAIPSTQSGRPVCDARPAPTA